MKPSDNLFNLIKSLDKSEKGYFKKFAASHSKNNNHNLLFDAIDAQERYDEAAILKKFKGQPFAKQIAVAKNYLWELILRSQRQYRRESSKFMQLNALLENGEILFEKGLYDDAMKQWDKAKNLALQYNEMPFLLDVETTKRRYYIDMTANNWQEHTDPSYAFSFSMIDAYSTMLKIQQKYVQIINVIKVQPYFRTEEQRAEWDVFMQDPLLALENEPASFWGNLYFNYIHNIYHLLCRNKEQAIRHIEKIVQLWDANPELKNMEPIKYISAVHNYLTNLMFLNEREAYIAYFENFKPPVLNSISREAVYFEHMWLMRISYFVFKYDYDGMTAFIESSGADLEKYQQYINKVRLLIIRFTSAFSKSIEGKFDDSNDLLHLVFDSKEVDLRKDLQAISRMLYTINHYEQNNLLLFKHVINTSKHFLRTNDFYYNTEQVFMKFMTRLAKEVDKQEKINLFEKMKSELEAIYNEQENEKIVIQQINLLEWITAKIENVPFKTILQMKKSTA